MFQGRQLPSGWWLLALERALIIVACLALGWYLGVRIVASRQQAAWAQELEERWARSPRQAAAVRPAAFAPHALVGRIDLPRLGVSAVIREGVDAGTLRSAVGHIPETALPGEAGNAAFAGHRDTFFRALRNVRKGDWLTIRTMDGRVHLYQVRETFVVDPSDVSVLAPGDAPMVTLVTCYPFDYVGVAPQRFVVSGTAVE